MSSTLVTPLLISIPFGTSAANPTYIKLPIPVPDQTGITINAASFTTGFPPSTMTPEASGGLPFFGQEMNGILWMISAYCANFAAGALSSYNSTLAGDISGYPVGVVLVNTNGTGLWINQVSGNSTNPDAGGAGWLPAAGVGGASVAVSTGTATLTALQWALPYIVLTGTLTGNVNVVFPTNEGQSWIIANNTTGGHTVTVSTSGGVLLTIPQTGSAAPTSVYCDGVDIQNTGVSTAGLAPINSPALTGTPTAPTASTGTNTTQIATTAFVQNLLVVALATYAPLASPTFTGTPTAPTPSPGDNSLKLATTAFVALAAAGAGTLSANGAWNFPGGFQIRWGSSNFSSGGGTPITFSSPFSTFCRAVVCTRDGAVSDSPAYGVNGVTRFGFNGITQGGSVTLSFWIAIGY